MQAVLGLITNHLGLALIVGSSANICSATTSGFAVDNATLTRFFALHFLLPFIISGLSIIHLLFLHTTGSSNPLGLNSNIDKSPFHPYFSYKDLLGIRIILFFYFYICFQAPWILGDPENFI